MTPQVASTHQAELRVAYDRALDVYESLCKQTQSTSINVLLLDLAQITVEAIDCYNNKTVLHPSSLLKVDRYSRCDGQSNIVKLGYSLSTLLNVLLTERSSLLRRRPLPAQQPSTSKATDPTDADPFEDMPEMIKEEPLDEGEEFHMEGMEEPSSEETSEDMKNETMEVKEEQADVVDVKEEMEEPMADVFCPATGTSRPHEAADFNQDAAGHAYPSHPQRRAPAEGLGLASNSRKGTAQPKIVIVKDGPNHILTRLPESSLEPSTSGAQSSSKKWPSKRDYYAEEGYEQQYVGRSRPCHLCGNFTDKYEILPPCAHKVKRVDFLDRVILSTPTIEQRVNALRTSSIQTVYFCSIHVATPNNAATTEGTVANKAANKKTSCDLCEMPQYPLTASPANPITRRRFFKTLTNLSTSQQKKVDYIMSRNEMEATICAKHFNKYDKKRENYYEEKYYATETKRARYLQMYTKNDDFKKRQRMAYISAMRAQPASLKEKPPIKPDRFQQKPVRLIPISRATPVRINVGYPKEPVKEELSGT